MLNPKEKAAELIKRFSPHAQGCSENVNKDNSVQCALILVDEMMKQNTVQIMYWQNVREALMFS